MKVVVVIPTYNEKENVAEMAKAVLGALPSPSNATRPHSPDTPPRDTSDTSLSVLFVDDNSPDGTGAIVDALSQREPRIQCLHRTQKEGLGKAYVAGFKRALALGADVVIQMDCDFSHDPKDIPRLLAAMNELQQASQSAGEAAVKGESQSVGDAAVKGESRSAGDGLMPDGVAASRRNIPSLVIGSRYVKGGATPGWPFKRRLISRCGGLFIRVVTGMPLRDPTGGFKCWSRAALEALDLDTVESAGYSFQLEMNHRSWKRGFAIREIPIVFTDRVAGTSKITAGIAAESIRIALRLRRGGHSLATARSASARKHPNGAGASAGDGEPAQRPISETSIPNDAGASAGERLDGADGVAMGAASCASSEKISVNQDGKETPKGKTSQT